MKYINRQWQSILLDAIEYIRGVDYLKIFTA